MNPGDLDNPRVFISSTVEDLGPYRDAARDAAIAAGFFPIMMEYFPANSSHPPLKECLHQVSKAAVLVVIVAYRYGWKPPDQPAPAVKSITWLECDHAFREGKEILAFLIHKDAAWPESAKEPYRLVTALERREATAELLDEIQGDLVRFAEFKSWLGRDRIRATFGNPDDLRGKVESALRGWRDRHGLLSAPKRRTDASRYMNWLREQTGWIDIRGLHVGTGKAHRFPVEELYIPLTSVRGPKGNSCQLEDALAEERLVIIGEPGSGKTTFLRRLTFELCGMVLRGQSAPRSFETSAPGDYQLALNIRNAFRRQTSGPLDPEPLIPILIRISDLADFVTNSADTPRYPRPSTQDSPAWLVAFLSTRSQEMNWGVDEEFFKGRLESGSAILLLDGLDETPERLIRELMVRLFENLTTAYPRCRFVLTSRPSSYVGQSVLPRFASVEIAPLDSDAVQGFLRKWCDALFSDNQVEAARHFRELSMALRAKEEIRRMANNPVMLTALAVVHWNERRLPEQRADLYESIIVWLARSRERRPGRARVERCLVLLQHLALAMFTDRSGRAVEVSKGWAAERLAVDFPQFPQSKRFDLARAFLDEEEIDSGILVSREGELRFWHLTFQEYLAARAIAGLADNSQRALLLDDNAVFMPEWRETVLLLAGILGLHQGTSKVDGLFTAVLDTLKNSCGLEEQAKCFSLLGSILCDLDPLGYRPTDTRFYDLSSDVLGIFDIAKIAGVELHSRLEAAEVLGRLGDPRLKLDNWVTIHGGTFWMGAQKRDPCGMNYDPSAHEIEGPVHAVTLDPFQIRRYPVTVDEYHEFIRDGGYSDPRLWKEGECGRTEPVGWEDQLLHPNRPVVGVTQKEALAWCLWAGCRLPTESEWERAARGLNGRRYPWGDSSPQGRANFDGGPPSPVGLYPSGVTPEGVTDMAGNVREWVQGSFNSYAPERGATDDRERRLVARGGGSRDDWEVLRSAFRIKLRVDESGGTLGFRAVRAVPPNSDR